VGAAGASEAGEEMSWPEAFSLIVASVAIYTITLIVLSCIAWVLVTLI